ncbi:MAG TPA: outer membrane beta-barrel protein [Vicinamibacterales bacterium]|nr:outer membrane beta-barrel protein [Vicinamibacterales bacterium]
MRVLVFFATLGLMGVAMPVLAQEQPASDPRGLVSVSGGFVSALGDKSSDFRFETGVRVAPHLMVYGNIGRFGDLHVDLQPQIDAATASFAANDSLDVSGTATVPAWYGSGGLRFSVPVRGPVSPYVLGGIGFARLSPTAQFTFNSGILPDGSTPTPGADVTSAIESNGLFANPAASTQLLWTTGGGALIAMGPHMALDAGYRYSRINADTTLNTSAFNANGLTFGVGYRF